MLATHRPDDRGVIRMRGGAWVLFEPFVFRSTGFPFERLNDLRLDETIGELGLLAAREREIETKRDGFLDKGFGELLAEAERSGTSDKAAFARLYAIRSAIIKRQPAPPRNLAALNGHQAADGTPWAAHFQAWNQALAGRDEAASAAAITFSAEIAERRADLWRMSRDADFAEAVFLSSPSAADGVAKFAVQGNAVPASNSKARATERVIYTYLQRLCAKNDTASFFGPVDYGRFAPECGVGLATTAEPTGRASRRRVFWAHWTVTAMARKLAEYDTVHACLKPRRNPLLRVANAARGEFFLHGVGRALRLDGAAAALLLQVDGTRSVAELACALNLKPDAGITLVRRLAAARLIDVALPIPSTDVDAFEALVRAVGELPDPEARALARPWLDEAEALRDGFESADWPHRRAWFDRAETWVAERLGDATRRKGGALYADRHVFYEDCAGSLRGLTAGGPVLTRVAEKLPGLTEFLAGVAVLRWYDAQDAVRARLGADGTSPVLRLIDLLMQTDPEPAPAPRFDAFARRLKGLIEQRRQPDRIELTAQDLDLALEPWREEIAAGLRRFPMLLPSPDLMIAARSAERLDAGDFELILAELHDDCSTVFGGFFACFHPDPEGIRAIFEDRIRSQNNWEMLGSVLGGRRSKHVTPELPGTTILLSGLSGRAATEPQVPIADVEIVEADDGHLVLRAGGRPIILYPGDLSSVVHEAFALPRVVPLDWLAIAGGTSIPRVSANGIVVQRATWDVDAAVFQLQAKGELGCAEFHELRQRIAALGIPEWFFIRWAKHEKPVLIDTRNPWALDLLRRIASQAVRVRAAEMYPDPGNIFWSSEQGHHTFELRTALLRENNDEQVRQGVLQ